MIIDTLPKFEQTNPLSNKAFEELASKIIINWLEAIDKDFKIGSFHPTGKQHNVTSKIIDIIESTDYKFILDNGLATISVATRMQFVTGDYKSFTLRDHQNSTRCEYDKLLFAYIRGINCRPDFRVQGYVDKKNWELKRLGMCKNDDLAEYILNGQLGVDYHNKAYRDGQSFVIIYWPVFANKYPLWVYEREDLL